MATKFKITEKKAAAQKAIRDMIQIAGNDYLLHFRKSFKNEGFTDENLVRWKPRKKLGRAAVHGRFKPILVKTGALKRSLKLVYGTNGLTAKVFTNIPYGKVHNEGLRSGRGAGFIMPKRQFIGRSRNLEKRILAKYISKINTAIKNA